jgi:hypothetical protein
MTDFTNSRYPVGSQFPTGATDAQETKRVESILTAAQLKDRFLFGIPLVSFFPHPVTGVRQEMSDENVQERIIIAVNQAELDLGIVISPVSFSERHPYDYNFWRKHAYIKVKKRPVFSVESYMFKAANGAELLRIDQNWIDMGQAHLGQINLVPIFPALAAQGITATTPTPTASATWALFSGAYNWVPSMIEIAYTCGFPGGQVPVSLNDYIGLVAAIDILSSLASTYKGQSYSLGIDGIQQSQSFAGPNQFAPRLEELTRKREALNGQIRDFYGKRMSISWF